MLSKILLPFALLAIAAQAIQITTPNNSTGWSSSGSQMIEWDSVSTDPGNFSIYISQPGSSAKQVIQKDVMTSEKSFIYTPSKDISPGQGYQISFLGSSDNGILAQSNQFEVKEGQSTLSATSTASLTTTAVTTASPTGGASTTAAGSGSQTSAAASSAAASSGSTSAGQLVTIPSGALLFVAGLLGIFA
ncbi:uncharacterized protein IL334_004598 [Kwoniella shivajii]|uniref:Yeast cell wall synthesis Kre9/Knh1-like N-terminal domain-containing protein n=1 Tax=Kwoniella shivajii TaxID=564305 RepID=A0ABZ1D3S4_9TREE|nr:hypothetical protein IL334_004598 [Kwoniella shivajii]